MVRAYDDNGNVVDLVKWEKQIRAEEREKTIDEYTTKLIVNSDYIETEEGWCGRVVDTEQLRNIEDTKVEEVKIKTEGKKENSEDDGEEIQIEFHLEDENKEQEN